MANIVGEGVAPFVKSQVEQREKVHGSINRTNDQLLYLNSKTAFVKMVSSVDVTEDIFNLGLTDSKLAEQYVLFNGVTDESTNTQRSGIARDKSINSLNAYGIGGLEFGLKPMMGITSVDIKNENRGSLRTSTVKLKAFNRTQFDIINTLYLKLGYFMLIEWGWSNYVKNDGSFEKDNPYSLADAFLTAKYNYDELLNQIIIQRNESEGNYDAIVGKVVNFTWSVDNDGAYDITVIIRSTGDVIESLKTNVLLPDDSVSTGKSDSQYSTQAKAALGTKKKDETDEAYNERVKTKITELKTKDQEELEEKGIATAVAKRNKHSLGRKLYDLASQSLKLTPGKSGSTTLSRSGDKNNKIFLSQRFKASGDGKASTQHYIQFGYLLDWIQSNLIPTIKKGNVKFVNIDTDLDSNLIYLEQQLISTDLRVCGFTTKFTFNSSGDEYHILPNGNDFVKYIGKGKNKNRYGKIMNLYFNINWVLNTIDSNLNEDGELSLFNFIKALCNGFTATTGNFNKLSPSIDTDTNTLKIVDEVPVPNKADLLENLDTVKFSTFGYINNQGSIIRNISLNTTISPQLATMITVGSTKNGYAPGYDATGLSTINIGTKDRIKPELKNDGTTSTDKVKKLEEKYKSSLSDFNTFLKRLGSKGKSSYPIWDTEAMDSYSSTIKNLVNYNQYSKTKEAQKENKYAASPSIGFIPFNLGLELDGISGIKIYNKFQIDSAFLPSNYPDSLEFLIKGISHQIIGNQWTTTIESLAVPKNPYGSGANPVRKQNNGSGSGESNLTGETPNADRLRTALSDLGYSEKGTEIANGGDITKETADMGIAVFKQIKATLPNLNIIVTGGNDRYHQNLNYNSRHKVGRGLDFVISPSTQSDVDKVVTILQGFAIGANPNFRYLNEYNNPTFAATAQHFHISWGPGTEGGSNLTAALKKKGKITSYNIA